MKQTIILSSIAILLTAVSLGYFVWFRPARVEQKVLAEQEKTEQRKSAENLVAAPGVVEAISEEIEVGAEVAGKLESVLVEEGDEVLKGQTIAVLENSVYKSKISEAQARIEILRRQKEMAAARLAQAKADKERIFNGARREKESKRNEVSSRFNRKSCRRKMNWNGGKNFTIPAMFRVKIMKEPREITKRQSNRAKLCERNTMSSTPTHAAMI